MIGPRSAPRDLQGRQVSEPKSVPGGVPDQQVTQLLKGENADQGL